MRAAGYVAVGLILGIAVTLLTGWVAPIPQLQKTVTETVTNTITETLSHTYTTTYTTTCTTTYSNTVTETITETETETTTETITETPRWCKVTLVDDQIRLNPGEGHGSSYYLEGAPGPGEIKILYTATGNVTVSVSQSRFNPEYLRVSRSTTGISGTLWMPIAQGIPITISINNYGNLPATVEIKAIYYYACPPPTETPPTRG